MDRNAVDPAAVDAAGAVDVQGGGKDVMCGSGLPVRTCPCATCTGHTGDDLNFCSHCAKRFGWDEPAVRPAENDGEVYCSAHCMSKATGTAH